MSAGEGVALRARRVGFLIDSLDAGAGTENQLMLLLRNFDRRRIAPYLICLRHGAGLARLGPVCETRVLGIERLATPRGIGAIVALSRWFRRVGLDRLVTFFRDASLVGTVAGCLAGVPVIGSRRNLGYWHNPLELRILRVTNAMTESFIANSEAARRHAIEFEGIRPSRIQVIYNALDTGLFAPCDAVARERTRRALRIPADCGPLLVCVANLRTVKGHDVLLDAFARVRLTFDRARLLLVGDGKERGPLEAQAQRLGLLEAVQFLGNRDGVAPIIAAADVGVLASHSESFPNAMLEYMACGLPTVSTAVGGHAELVPSSGIGLVVPAGDPLALSDAIVELCRDERRMRDAGREARLSVQRRFSIPQVLSRWYDHLGATPVAVVRSGAA